MSKNEQASGLVGEAGLLSIRMGPASLGTASPEKGSRNHLFIALLPTTTVWGTALDRSQGLGFESCLCHQLAVIC